MTAQRWLITTATKAVENAAQSQLLTPVAGFFHIERLLWRQAIRQFQSVQMH